MSHSSRSKRVRVEAALDELVRADILEREHLQVGAEVAHATRLERADHDGAPPADLGVEERVGDRQRHLVPELRRAHRVADDQHVRSSGAILAGSLRAMTGALAELKQRLAEIEDLESAIGVLVWDQRTTMPPRARPHARRQSRRSAASIHERFVADEIGRLLDELRPLEESSTTTPTTPA